MKQPRNGFSFFSADRFASGDFAGISIRESGTLIGKEWHALSENAKKVRTTPTAWISNARIITDILFSAIPRPSQCRQNSLPGRTQIRLWSGLSHHHPTEEDYLDLESYRTFGPCLEKSLYFLIFGPFVDRISSGPFLVSVLCLRNV